MGVTGLVFAGLTARAADVGLPPGANDVSRRASVEVYGERFRRDANQDFLSKTTDSRQKEDRSMARASYLATRRLTLHVDAGSTKSEDSEDAVPIYGAGLFFAVCDRPAVHVDAFASGTYVRDIEYRAAGAIDEEQQLDHPDVDQTESYYEINAGLTASRLLDLGHKTTVTPYGGFMLSRLRGDEEYDLTYHTDRPPRRDSGVIRDGTPFSAFAGAGFSFGKHFGIRIEGRFLNQESYSAGLLYFF